MIEQKQAVCRWKAAVAIAGGLMLGGCSSDSGGLWPFAGGEPAKPKTVEINHDDYARLGYRIAWTGYATMVNGGAVVHADLHGDVLAVIDSNAFLSVLSTSSGETRWATGAGEPLTVFVGTARTARQLICCSNHAANVYDIETGALSDRQVFAKVVSTAPLRVGPYLAFGTQTGEAMGHLMTTNIRAWGYAVNGSIRTDGVLMGGQDAAFVTENGDVLIVDASTGASRGRAKIFGGIAAPPAATGDALFIASLDQSVYCFERFGGAMRWRYRTDSVLRYSPAVHAGSVYVDIPSAGLTALDVQNGRKIWSAPGVTGEVIAVRGKRLVVWDGTTATTLEMDGSVVERAVLPNVAAILTDRFEDGSLYVVRKGGSVSKFNPR